MPLCRIHTMSPRLENNSNNTTKKGGSGIWTQGICLTTSKKSYWEGKGILLRHGSKQKVTLHFLCKYMPAYGENVSTHQKAKLRSLSNKSGGWSIHLAKSFNNFFRSGSYVLFGWAKSAEKSHPAFTTGQSTPTLQHARELAFRNHSDKKYIFS